MASASRRRPVIAIDGPAGAGKSTVARTVARRTGFAYLDTGAMYRAVALAVREAGLEAGPELLDPCAVGALLEGADLRVLGGGSDQRVLLDGEDVTSRLRAPEIDRLVPLVSRLPEVRRALMAQQRRLAAGGGIVADGRDMGTAVLPDADYKFFLTADLAVRARRRQGELRTAGTAVGLQAVERDLAERDLLDGNQLRQAPDAILVDTTHLTVEQAVQRILAACPGLVGSVAPTRTDGGGP